MKQFYVGLFLAFITASIGCNRTGNAGGPGATATASKPIIGQADDTFVMTMSAVSVKQGETAPGSIGIKRGTNFDQDVAVTFDDLPKGVTLEPKAPVIQSQGTEAKFTLSATDEAALGDFTIKVRGHPGKGGDATNQFKLTIGKKDTFTLSMPFWTTGLKQGESKSVAIAISRDKKFDQDVTLKFDGLPKGVTVEPAGVVIKSGDTEAKVSLKASDDAPLGDFAVMVIGHPAKGADASHEFKFTIAKK